MLRQLPSQVILLEGWEDFDYHVDGTGILMAKGQWTGMSEMPWRMVPLIEEIEELRSSKVIHWMVNKILPGGRSGVHVDPSPQSKHFERWHLSIKTNHSAYVWTLEEGVFHMRPKWWHGPFAYWEPHEVWNAGPTDRIHLVVDLEKELA